MNGKARTNANYRGMVQSQSQWRVPIYMLVRMSSFSSSSSGTGGGGDGRDGRDSSP